uniref:Cytochrome b n=1 Tax=Arisubathynella cheongmiensis TaxID=2025387 RepID=A0A7R6D8J8_9CRUS|nr:cytochrome b [Arisubathynella cheongmiensis]
MLMMMNLRKDHIIFKGFNMMLVDMPIPLNISFMWNMGSFMGFCLFMQIITGLFLSMHYSPEVIFSFQSISHISRDVNQGVFIRIFHANFVSLFFILLYIHIGRGLYYGSYFYKEVWNSGIIIIFILMAIAFMGYVLPWGQMSFWGATVITNLISAIPYFGKSIVTWIWGGFSIEQATLSRFFVFHFILPFMLLILVTIHILFLHESGSSQPLGSYMFQDKTPFHFYFSFKDIFFILVILLFFCSFFIYYPFFLGDCENFIEANPLLTPIHIQPEWYFLFAYALLRAVPNKLGGVISLLASILILFVFILLKEIIMQSCFSLTKKNIYWMLVTIFFLLTWLGARPVEFPYLILSQLVSILYFMTFICFMYDVKMYIKFIYI